MLCVVNKSIAPPTRTQQYPHHRRMHDNTTNNFKHCISKTYNNATSATMNNTQDTIQKCEAFVVLHNDGQYCYKSIHVIGVLPTLDEALLMGWKAVIEEAMKPWSVRFYKKEYNKNLCGLGTYTVEAWDMKSNTRITTYYLGTTEDANMIINVTDKYLKKHRKEYETIVQGWYDDIMAKRLLPDELQQQTFQR